MAIWKDLSPTCMAAVNLYNAILLILNDILGILKSFE